jgi:hypothetical protein
MLEAPDTGVPMATRQADLPTWLQDFPYEIQPWPTLIGREKLDELRRATIGCTRLVKSIPQRLLEGDPKRINDFYALGDEMLVALAIESPNGIDQAFARCDFVDTEEGLRCVEVNASAFLGGWQLRFWEGVLRTEPLFARFVEREEIEFRYSDPLLIMLDHVIRNARKRVIDGELNLVVLVPEHFPSLRAVESYFDGVWRRVLMSVDPGLSGRVAFCRSGEELSADGTSLRRDGRPIHVFIEYTAHKTPSAVYRRFKAGKVDLYNGPIATELGNKRGLALLSQHADSDQFDQAERSIIRDYIPWTREVTPGTVDYRGHRAEIRDLLIEQRSDLVLKPIRGARGEGVHLGLHTESTAWRRVIDQALRNGGWIVQERAASRPFLYQNGESGFCPHDTIWGMFCFGDTYGGGFLRMMPQAGSDGIVNAARGATEGCIFEIR